MKPHLLIPLVLALALSAGAGTPAAPAAGCRHADAVFYTTDSQKLAGDLWANRSACTDYYVSVTPGGDATLATRPAPVINPRAIATAIHTATGPQIHVMAEVRPSEWAKWMAEKGKNWFDAGVEARARMKAAGYSVAAGDTWAVNELGADALAGGAARANLSQFVSGLYTGDGTPSKGLVFMADPLHVTTDLSTYHDQLQTLLGDTAFWTGIADHVRFWGQEVYTDSGAWGVPGTDQATRRTHLDAYLEHALTLADAGPGSVDAARSFLDQAYTPIGNAAWLWPSAFGNTNVSLPVMDAFVASQTDAFRMWPNDRFGFAYVPRAVAGVPTAASFDDLRRHLAAAIHNSDTDPAGACALSACSGDLPGAAFNDAWTSFAAWSPPTNTLEGRDVTVTPAPGVTVTFSSVTSRGSTQASASSPSPVLPEGYVAEPGALAVDVTTTALYTGGVTVCLGYAAANYAGRTPRLLGLTGGMWHDVTTTTGSNNVCGAVATLSSFAVAGADPPVLTVPDTVTVTGTDPDGAAATYVVSATSAFDLAPLVVCTPASGSVFPYGTTHVACTASDSGDGRTSASFDVRVLDGTPPVIVPGVSGPMQNGWYTGDVAVHWSVSDAQSDVTGSDGCGDVTISTDTSGTTLTCSATSEGGTSSATVTIKRDTTAPVVTVPQSVTVDATGPAGGTATYAATAVDALDATPVLHCDPPSGASFPIGTSSVTCSATDAAGNVSTAGFSIIVEGAVDQLRDLSRDTATAVGLPFGIRTALLAKVDNALARFDVHHACVLLAAYSNVLSVPVVPTDVAAPLLADAARIRTVIGC